MRKHNFNTPWDSDYWMESNGLFCGFNMPEALKSIKSKADEEILQELPAYNWRSSFLVDEYPACPNDWMRSQGKTTSYFVPIQEGKGMWLDFNKNKDKKHDVAIVVSIQGVNAITGLPCNDSNLEQYTEQCPKHKKPFGPNRLCEECGYKWPHQNYICTTGTPNGQLWIDGFRAANGAVQQYILTEQTMRGVASNIIGSKRVYAIGISFFLSKESKREIIKHIADNDYTSITYTNNTYGQFYSPVHTPSSWNVNRISDYYDATKVNIDSNISTHEMDLSISTISDSCSSLSSNMASSKRGKKVTNTSYNPTAAFNYTPIVTRNMEIGAGASIRQQVYDDTEPLDYWRAEPEAIMCINYCTEIECEQILKQGKINKQGHPQGFLKDVPVGN